MQSDPIYSRIQIKSPNGYTKGYTLNRLCFSIGSQLDADILHPQLHFSHAELKFELGEWVIRQTNPRALLTFNDHTISMKKLNPGDIIYLNEIALLFQGIENTSETQMTDIDISSLSEPKHIMVVLNGKDKHKSFLLHPGDYIIGRKIDSPRNQDNFRIELDSDFISKNHARIWTDGDNIIIEDLKSTNGIEINGRLITKTEIIPPRIIKLGKLKIEIKNRNDIHNNDGIETLEISTSSIFQNYRFWLNLAIAVLGAISGLIYCFHD